MDTSVMVAGDVCGYERIITTAGDLSMNVYEEGYRSGGLVQLNL